MAGLLSNTLREPGPDPEPEQDARDVDVSNVVVDQSKPEVLIKFPDGSVSVNILGARAPTADLKNSKWGDNLALALDDTTLSIIAEELLEGIDQDELSRQDWIEERAEGIKLLALKIEKPSSSSAGSAGGVDNTSRSRHTLLLEAALRFQANAQGEMLPTDGPVKIEAKLGRDSASEDDLAQLLEDDFNYYLQTTASEYYPDTERMLFWAAVGGCGFKKVYRCPIRRRPVSESVDAIDLIVSNNATDLQNADRVTFRVKMRQSTMKRMQFLKVYRPVDLGQPSAPQKNSVDEEKEGITGVSVSMRPEDLPFEVLECYCMIDVPGDEHEDKGEISGLPRPYKVSIDRSSRNILEIRRNWRQEDDMERPREVFVKYPYVPGFGFYELGLIHIAGNPTVAATALLRIMIDSGIFGNFPGGLVAKSTEKQNTTDINVPPGGFAPIDVSMIPDGDIKKAVMPLPYKSPDNSIFQLLQDIVTTGSRVAGAADISVGEGKQDAPVGTTIALIEQATKVTDAVHKRMHTSQSKELSLLRDLFRENPEDFWKFNKERDANWDAEKLLKALNDYNLVPRADPNTSSQMQRIMRWQALYQMAKGDPAHFNIMAIYKAILRILGINNPDDILSQTTGAPPPDPVAEAKLISAQADQTGANAKLADVQLRAKNNDVENQNRDADRNADLQIQAMKLKSEQLIHGNEQAADAQSQASTQQHEAGLAAAQTQSDQAQTAAGLLSEHALQSKDHDHAIKLAKAKPPAMKPSKPKGSP